MVDAAAASVLRRRSVLGTMDRRTDEEVRDSIIMGVKKPEGQSGVWSCGDRTKVAAAVAEIGLEARVVHRSTVAQSVLARAESDASTT